MSKKTWALALPLLLVAACGSKPKPVVVAPAPAPAPVLAAADQGFATSAAASDAFEIQSSQLALSTSHSPAVKAFAQKMVDSHTASTQALMEALKADGVPAPAPQLTAEQQADLDKLKGLKGAKFDAAYKQAQEKGHQMALEQAQQEANTTTDSQLKKVATERVGVIQGHLSDLAALSAPMHGHGRRHGHKAHHAA